MSPSIHHGAQGTGNVRTKSRLLGIVRKRRKKPKLKRGLFRPYD